MRPRDLSEFAGQEHILGPGKLLRRAIESDRFMSLILYGPPGVGKTALAHLIAERSEAHFVSLNAVTRAVISEKSPRRRGSNEAGVPGGPFFLSTRSTASRGFSRMPCCPMSNAGTLP
jgi:putative ATPase